MGGMVQMKKKFIFQMVVDMIMTVLLLFLMARQLTGESAHEWLGAGMFLLWIAHHILNRNWYSHLFKGKYTPVRILQTVINFAVLLSMLGLMVSGILLSREVFAFLPVSGGIAMARQLHILSAFWGYVLMALHLGLHWNRILGMARKAAGSVTSGPLRILLRAAAVLVAGYGLYAFLKNQFLSYMFLTTHFVFFDFERPVLLFFTEYLAIMGLFVFLAHYASRGIQKLNGGRKK
ncbi:hypothetical protein BRYFOR_06195 [Marvinbryantia formatexigens DSM 14469]|uniref:Flavinylation-associated cytochrome domain-containing protein n=2 Tax=Marvinbryantia TaxID=248744 RepID=C6LC48_9FIRM|nr:hypothetical protein BRYFOR_06195 [Marvinbryantia formatexigens DSM 14469]